MVDLTDLDRAVFRLSNLFALAGDGINVKSKQTLINRATAEGIDPNAVMHSLTCLVTSSLVETAGDDGPTVPRTVTPAGFEEWAGQGVDNFGAVVLLTAQWIPADVRTSTAIIAGTGQSSRATIGEELLIHRCRAGPYPSLSLMVVRPSCLPAVLPV